MAQATAIALPTTQHSVLLSKVQHIIMTVGEFMYGSKERSWATLAVAFALLVTGINLMQTSANGGFCAVGG